jgi:hypothetical protein
VEVHTSRGRWAVTGGGWGYKGGSEVLMVVSTIRWTVTSYLPWFGGAGSVGREGEGGRSCTCSAGGLGCPEVGVTLEEAPGWWITSG